MIAISLIFRNIKTKANGYNLNYLQIQNNINLFRYEKGSNYSSSGSRNSSSIIVCQQKEMPCIRPHSK